MASSINASTSGSGGVITTADNSGILNLQSNGTTVATVSSTGFSTPANQTINTANTFGFKNRIINGAMVINQRGASGNITTGAYQVDRFRYYLDTSPLTATFTQSTTAPTGFTNSALFTVTSAGTLTSGQGNTFLQSIEGLNVADLGWGTADAKTVTVSAWVRSSATGTFGGSLTNYNNTRSYPFTYTISSANTWTQISATIPGDTSGTWKTDTSTGITLWFSLGTGSTLSGAAGSWASANYISATGATSIVGTNGATFYITGVQLEVGSQATSFDFRSYGTELALCQRYYQAFVEGGGYFHLGSAISSYQVRGPRFTFFQTMRTNPSITLPTAGTGAGQMYYCQTSGAAASVGSFTAQQIRQDSFFLEGETWTGVTTGSASLLAAGSGGVTIAVSAEL